MMDRDIVRNMLSSIPKINLRNQCIYLVLLQSQVITVCQDIADTLDNGDRMDAIIVDFSKAFDLVPHGRLLVKIANSGVDARVVEWIKQFLIGRKQRVRVDGELSDEVRVTSGVPQGSVLGPLLFLAYVKDIGRNIASKFDSLLMTA